MPRRSKLLLAVTILTLAIGLAWWSGSATSAPSAREESHPAPAGTADATPEGVDVPTGIDVATPTAGGVREAVVRSTDEPARRAATVAGRIRLLPGIPIEGAVVHGYPGDAGDVRHDFAQLWQSMDSARRRQHVDLSLELRGKPIVSAPIRPDGTFEFVDVPAPTHLRLTLRHRFYAFAHTEPVRVPADADRVELGTVGSYAGGHIIGRVAALDDRPRPADATIRLASDLDPMAVLVDPQRFAGHVTRGGGTTTPLHSDGHFEFAAVWPAPSTRLLLRDDTIFASCDAFSIAAGETREILLVPQHPAELEVVCRSSAGGSPLANATVTAEPQGTTGEFTTMHLMQRGRTDDDGIVRLTGLGPGDYKISVTRGDHLGADRHVGVEQADRLRVEFDVPIGGRVAGIVQDHNGQPIVDAGVGSMGAMKIPMFGDLSTLAGPEIVAQAARNSSVRTDDDGRFTLTGLPPDAEAGEVNIVAWHDDYVGGLAHGVRAGDEDVTVTLNRAGTVRGRVVQESADGELLPVTTFDARTKVSLMGFMDRTTSSTSVRDGDDGEFVLDSVPPGKCTILVAAKGLGERSQRITVEEGTELDIGTIELAAAATIRGVVVDPDGVPVGGATVQRKRGGFADNPILSMFLGVDSAETDDEGRFELANVTPGRVRLLATARDHASGESDRFPCRAGELVEDVRIELTTGGAIEGRLVLPTGEVLDDWSVFAQRQPNGNSAAAVLDPADGSFRIEHLDPGTYQVQAMNLVAFQRSNRDMINRSRPGQVPDLGKLMRDIADITVTVRTRVRDGETETVLLDGSDLGSASGVELVAAVSLGGKPLSTGFVEIVALEGTQPRIGMGVVEDGELRVRNLERGVVQLQLRSGMAMAPVGDPHRVEITADEGIQRMRWDLPGGSIAGRVVDAANGEPLVGAAVRLIANDPDRTTSGSTDFGFALTDADGQFSFRGLTPGAYAVTADNQLFGRTDDSRGARVDGLRIAAGEELTGLELRTEPGARVRLEVQDERGRPVARAMALATDADGQAVGSLPIAFTDSDGEAAFAGLPSGEVRVVVRAEGWAPAASDVQELTPDRPATYRVRLEKGTPVELQVVGDGDRPLDGALIRLRWKGGPWVPSQLLNARPLADGVVDLGRLPPGPTEFRIDHPAARFTVKRDVPRGAATRLVVSPQ